MNSTNIKKITDALYSNGIVLNKTTDKAHQNVAFTLDDASDVPFDEILEGVCEDLKQPVSCVSTYNKMPLLDVIVGNYSYELMFDELEDIVEVKQLPKNDGKKTTPVADFDDDFDDDELDGGFGDNDSKTNTHEDDNMSDMGELPVVEVKELRAKLRKSFVTIATKAVFDSEVGGNAYDVNFAGNRQSLIGLIKTAAEAMHLQVIEDDQFNVAIEHGEGVYGFVIKQPRNKPLTATMYSIENAEVIEEEEQEEEEKLPVVDLKQLRTALHRLQVKLPQKPDADGRFELEFDGAKKEFLARVTSAANRLGMDKIEHDDYNLTFEHAEGIYGFFAKSIRSEFHYFMESEKLLTEEEEEFEEFEEGEVQEAIDTFVAQGAKKQSVAPAIKAKEPLPTPKAETKASAVNFDKKKLIALRKELEEKLASIQLQLDTVNHALG